jgi:hypothetical protein
MMSRSSETIWADHSADFRFSSAFSGETSVKKYQLICLMRPGPSGSTVAIELPQS